VITRTWPMHASWRAMRAAIRTTTSQLQ
jgi:hypothetical protein